MSRLGDPVRRCLACRRREPASGLVRLVVCDGRVVVDPSRRLPGRGAHLCHRQACRGRALRREARALRRALRAAPGVAGPDAGEVEAARAALAERRGDDVEDEPSAGSAAARREPTAGAVRR